MQKLDIVGVIILVGGISLFIFGYLTKVLQYGIIFIYIIPLVGIGLGVLVFSRIRIKKQKSYLGKRNNTQSTHLSKDSQNIETNPTSSSPENNRKCKVCGTNIPSESKNCPGCGDIYS